MGIFSKLVKVVLDVAETPVAIIKDVATLGGALTEQDKPYTAQKIEQISDDYNEMKDEL